MTPSCSCFLQGVDTQKTIEIHSTFCRGQWRDEPQRESPRNATRQICDKLNRWDVEVVAVLVEDVV